MVIEKCKSEITPELLKDWAVEICKSVLEKEESSMSSGEEIG